MTRRMDEPGLDTGLKDKHGAPIHLGDTLNFDRREWGGVDTKFVVSFVKGELLIKGGISDLSEFCEIVSKHEAAPVKADPTLLTVAKNAAATIGAIYEWVARVETAGGATTMSGIATCHAMITSLRKNAQRTDDLVIKPVRAAIAAAAAEKRD